MRYNRDFRMRETIRYIEQPILYAASRGMSFVYRRFGISPVRQVPGWEITVATVEMTAILSVGAFLYSLGERQFVYLMPFLALSVAFDALSGFIQLWRIPRRYYLQAYRKAATEAEGHRQGGLYIRAASMALPFWALLVFSFAVPAGIAWMAWCAIAYYALYSSKFFVRACEPPHPDEGEFETVPQFG